MTHQPEPKVLPAQQTLFDTEPTRAYEEIMKKQDWRKRERLRNLNAPPKTTTKR